MKKEEEYLPVGKLNKKAKRNKELERIFYCLACKYNLLSIGGTIKKKAVRILICDECQKTLGVSVSYNNIRKLSYIRKNFPYKSMIILMAIYNLLKNEDNFSNEPEVEELIKYVKRTNNSGKLYHQFCLKGSLPDEIYNHTAYKESDKYRKMYNFYISSYDQLINSLGKQEFIKICKNNFIKSQFGNSDVPIF